MPWGEFGKKPEVGEWEMSDDHHVEIEEDDEEDDEEK